MDNSVFKATNIFRSFFSLGIIQVLNYLVPFLILPIIVRIIGAQYFGLINFAQSFVVYFTLVINFGFDFTATRLLSQNQNNSEWHSEIFWNIFWSKILLFILSTLIFALALISIKKLFINYQLILICYLINVGWVLFPTWFFQGIGKMPMAAFIIFTTKSTCLILLFLIIKTKQQYILFPLALTIAQISAGIWAFIYIVKKYNLKFENFNFQKVKKGILDSFHVFLSTLVVNFYTSTNIVILGFLSSAESTGIFAASAKIITVALLIIQVPLGQVLFPVVGAAFKNSEKNGIEWIKLTFWGVGLIGLITSIIIYFNASIIIKILFGTEFNSAINCLKILSTLPFLICLSNVFAVQGLLNMHMDKKFLFITVIGAAICLILNLITDKRYAAIGTCWVWVITELFITVASGIVLIRRKVYFWDFLPIRKIIFRNV